MVEFKVDPLGGEGGLKLEGEVAWNVDEQVGVLVEIFLRTFLGIILLVLGGIILFVLLGIILLVLSWWMWWVEFMLRIASLIWAMMVSLPVAASVSHSFKMVLTKRGA